MSDLNSWLESSVFALPLLVLALMVFMYLGRSVGHGVLRSLFGGLSNAFRMGAKAVMASQERLLKRNREVLLEMGREQAERVVEREFHRVNGVVAGDLSGYPALHRKLSDEIARIDEDYREATEVPPSPPAWVKAVETIAQIPANGDPIVGRVLGDINKTIVSAHKSAMKEYRDASRKRHKLLEHMLPIWRRLDQTLSRVHGTISGLNERSRVIDQQMDKYEQIRKGSDEAVRMLSTSSMTNFTSSLLVLLIALGGAFINFHLIALPMSEMVGAAAYVGPMKVSSIAAMVIILIEIAMGLFLMESLRITRLFPVIHTMDDTMRRRLIWVSFVILLTLACVESSLAYMRDMLAADREALTQQLAGVAVVAPAIRWIPSVGQMVMGFMLPFALTFVAIPLESFIHSSRTVFGSFMAVLLRGIAGTFAILGSIAMSLGEMLVHVYDLVIVVPLRIEQLVTGRETHYRGRSPLSEGGVTPRGGGS